MSVLWVDECYWYTTMPKLNFGALDMSDCKWFSLVLITGIIISFGNTLESVGLHSPLYISIFNNHGFASLAFKYPRCSISVPFYQSWHLAFVLNCISPWNTCVTRVLAKKLYEFLRHTVPASENQSSSFHMHNGFETFLFNCLYEW